MNRNNIMNRQPSTNRSMGGGGGRREATIICV